ncbi:MAG: hypothetical protein PVH88_26680 [Ignavibacteria bacterium]|jgi:hypothetical protein
MSFFLKKEDGYILSNVIVFSFVIVSLLIGVLFFYYILNSITVKKISKKELDLACYSAAQLFIQNITNYNTDKEILINDIPVLISSRLTGLYLKISATAKSGVDSSKVFYHYGQKSDSLFDNALIMSTPQLRASVAGNTKITGNVLATNDNFKKGNIFGITRIKGDFIDGKIIKEDNIEQKAFTDSLLHAIFYTDEKDTTIVINDNVQLTERNFNEFIYEQYKINGDLSISGDIISKKDLEFIVSGSTGISRNTNLDLNLEILTDSSLTVNSGCKIKNAVFISRKDTYIKKDNIFENVKLFAEKNISVENSMFLFPSIIAAYSDVSDSSNLNNTIELEATVVNGSVILINSTVGLNNNKTMMSIDNNSIVHGLIYCENLLELEAPVKGIVYTYKFYFYKKPTTYINWLVNVNINRSELDEWFLFPAGFTEKNNFELLKEEWLY